MRGEGSMSWSRQKEQGVRYQRGAAIRCKSGLRDLGKDAPARRCIISGGARNSGGVGSISTQCPPVRDVIARCQEQTCVCFKAVSPPNRSNLCRASSTTANSLATAANSRELSILAGRGWAVALLSGSSLPGHRLCDGGEHTQPGMVSALDALRVNSHVFPQE